MLLHRSNHQTARLARPRLALLLAVLVSALVARASAGDRDEASTTSSLLDVANPSHFQCVGRNHFSGAASVPTERSGVTTSHAYAMIFIDPVQGHPTIVYGERYQRIAPLFQAFIRRHECQHANGVQDEITANCGALVQMRALGLSAEQETQIAQWHVAEGSIDPRYGGTGARFWQLTLDCAGAR